MSQNKLRISIIGMLLAVAVASYGCGGGGGLSSAVIRGSETTTRSESGDAILGESPTVEGEENETGDSTQNPQSTNQSVDNDNQKGGAGNASDNSANNLETETKPDYSLTSDEDAPLPPGLGLDPGQIVIFHKFSKQFGNTIITCPREHFGWCYVHVGEDGSATYALETDHSVYVRTPSFERGDIMLPRSIDAAQAPVHDFVNTLHVGAGVAPQGGELTEGVDRGEVSFSYGEVQDGIGADRILEFMGYHVRPEDKHAYSGVNNGSGLETFLEPPTIRLAEGTSDLYARFAAHAVQLINSALPYDKRIRLSTETLPVGTNLNDVPEGEILLKFAPRTDFDWGNMVLGYASLNSSTNFNSITQRDEVIKAINGAVSINEAEMRLAFQYDPANQSSSLAERWDITRVDHRRVENSETLIKWFNDRMFVTVLVHELIHALGFYHIDKNQYAESIMNPYVVSNGGQVSVQTPYLRYPTFMLFGITVCTTSCDGEGESSLIQSSPGKTLNSETNRAELSDSQTNEGALVTPKAGSVPGHILSLIDKAALLAAYGRFAPGTQPEELTAENLGDWSDTSFHLRGDMGLPVGQASFGVASSNGLAQPWATGPAPWTDLADSQELSGSVTWSGALLGVDSSSETVAGDAGLTVDLSSLTGRIDFTSLEKWGVAEAPGAAGSGEMWGDGDLGYTVEVHGNTFIQTGGDEGQVTGAFFGAAHEAMGGVLERADLSAGFGGKR